MSRFEVKEISEDEKAVWKKEAAELGVSMKGLWKWVTKDLHKIAKTMKVKK